MNRRGRTRKSQPPRRVVAVMAASILAIAYGTPARSASIEPIAFPQSSPVDRPDSSALLLEVHLGTAALEPILLAYPHPGGLLLPLGSLTRALDLAIEVDPARGQARGFLIDERRRFVLDLIQRTIEIGGVSRPLPSAGVEAQVDDIYADAAILEKWLPVDLVPDFRAAVLQVRPREPLPLQKRLERRARARSLLGAGDACPPIEGPVSKSPYRAWDWAAVDMSLAATQRPAIAESKSDWRYALDASGDCLFLETHVWLGGERERPWRSVRVTAGRREPDPVLLGPLRARQFALGDVLAPELDLISLPSAGKGLLLSSFPLAEPQEFERRSLRGVLPAGWDVELYRNDVLLDYREAGADGTYEFAAVPVLYGTNVFRLVFHGPQGQLRSESETVLLGRSLTPPGARFYRLIALDGDEVRGRRAQAELTSSLGRRLSGTLRLASIDFQDRRHLYGSAGLRGTTNHLFGKLDAAGDSAGGVALQFGLGSRLGALGLWLQHARLTRGFTSEVFVPSQGQIRDRSTVRGDLELRLSSSRRMPLSLEWRRDGLVDGGATHTLIQETAAGVSGFSVFHRFQALFVAAGERSTTAERLGRLLVGRGMRGIGVRGAIEYELGGRTREASLTAETRVLRPLLVDLELIRRPGDRRFGYRMVTAPAHGPVAWSFETGHTPGSGTHVSLGLSLGLNREPRRGRWLAQAAPSSETGAASALVFLDEDGDGRREIGERPLEGVEVCAGNAAAIRTGPDGVALLRGLDATRAGTVGVRSESLEDPLWLPPQKQTALLPRPGRTQLVEIPVLVSSEITGTVLRRSATEIDPAPARVELVDALSGEIVRRTHSAFDGFYDLAGLRPGRYILRAIAEGAWAAALEPASREILLAAGNVLEGMDLVLQDKNGWRLPTTQRVP